MESSHTAGRQTVDPSEAFSQHRAFVRTRLRGLGVVEADLDDATQDVFEVLVRRIADYDDRYPVRGWMAGIARRIARRYRERGKRVVVPIGEPSAAGEGPEEEMARLEARQLLDEFLAELEPERWSVFVLSEVEGLRGSEIAEELGVNQNTVYARLRSARTAFERKLRRHHARDHRRWWVLLPAWLGGSSRPGWIVPVLGTALLGSVLVVGVTLGRCGSEAARDEMPTVTVPEATVPTSGGVEARPTDPAAATATPERPSTAIPDADGWYGAGSAMSTAANSKGEPYTLSREGRYRFDGDRVTYEITYIGDDDVDVDEASATCTMDGLEAVDGEARWSTDVPAGQTRSVNKSFRATRLGTVRMECDGRRFTFVNDRGELRRCEGDECLAPVGEETEALSGETITVNVVNECEVAKEFVLFAGYPDARPPPDARVYRFEPGERRRMKIDREQWFLHRRPDGSVGGGVKLDTDGGWVRFGGSGQECDRASASDH